MKCPICQHDSRCTGVYDKVEEYTCSNNEDHVFIIKNNRKKFEREKQHITNAISDMFSDFFYYDRKEDDDFTKEMAQNISEYFTREELIDLFAKQIEQMY